jgi:hypothetical protein
MTSATIRSRTTASENGSAAQVGRDADTQDTMAALK